MIDRLRAAHSPWGLWGARGALRIQLGTCNSTTQYFLDTRHRADEQEQRGASPKVEGRVGCPY